VTLAGCLEMLPHADVEVALILLGKIERLGRGQRGVARQLLPMLQKDDFRLRARIFTCLGRLGDLAAGDELIRFLQTESREEWQMWAVETLHQLICRNELKPRLNSLDGQETPDLMIELKPRLNSLDGQEMPDLMTEIKLKSGSSDTAEKAMPMRWINPLSCFLDDPEKPILVRGCVWLIGALGGQEAVGVIASFLSRPAGRLVKDEVSLEALQMAVSSWPEGHAYLQSLQAANPAVDRAMRYVLLPMEKPRFRVLPYPDYFLDQAKESGLSPRSFRELLFWDRS